MASFEKRKTGWLARVQRKGIRDSRTFDTKKEAEDWARVREKEILSMGGNASEVAKAMRQKITFKEVMDRYVREVSSQKTGSETPKRESQRAHQMQTNPEHSPLNTLMVLNISEVEHHHIAEWKSTRLKYVKNSTVNREKTFLSHVFTKAKEWGYIDDTPFGGKVKFEEDKEEEERERGVTDNEIEMMMFVLDDWDGERKPSSKKEKVALLWSLCLQTGMRMQEAKYLTPEEVDIEAGVVDLPAKRCKERRKKTVALSEEAIKLLKLGRSESDTSWFDMDGIHVSSIFSHATTKTTIEDLQFRDSRHRALTDLSEKLEPFELARQAGHRNMNRTLKYYRKTAREFAHKLRD